MSQAAPKRKQPHSQDPRVLFPLIEFDVDAGMLWYKDTGTPVPSDARDTFGRKVVSNAYLLRDPDAKGWRRVDKMMCLVAHGNPKHNKDVRESNRVQHVNGVSDDDAGANLQWEPKAAAAGDGATEADDDDMVTEADSKKPRPEPPAAAAAAAFIGPPLPPVQRKGFTTLHLSTVALMAPGTYMGPVFQVTRSGAAIQVVQSFASIDEASTKLPQVKGALPDVIKDAIVLVLDIPLCQACGYTWCSPAGLAELYRAQ